MHPGVDDGLSSGGANPARRGAEPIRVCFCVDEIMAMPVGVAIESILRTVDRSRKLVIHLAQAGLRRDSRTKLEDTVAGRAEVVWHDMMAAAGRQLDLVYRRSAKNYPPSIYGRLILGSLLPPEVGRVLYLDADILVKRDLGVLWDTDLGEAPMAASPDVVDRERSVQLADAVSVEDRTRYGYHAGCTYFSSGVLLFDLAQLRTWLASETFEVMDRYPALSFPDQDALNIVAGSRYRHLDRRWNQLGSAFLDEAADWTGLSPEDLEALRRDPWIVHFGGPQKPWKPDCVHPSLADWQEVFRSTPWATERRGPWRRGQELWLRARRQLRKRLLNAVAGRPRKAG